MGKFTRRAMLTAAGAAFATAAVGSAFGVNILRRRPKNVVFVICDALRADRIGYYGYRGQTVAGPVNPTPALDELAENGLVFERCVAPSSWTLESVAAIVSSRLPLVEGNEYNEGFAPAKDATIAETLKGANYSTLAVVSNPWLSVNSDTGSRMLAARGFDVWNVPATEMVANPLHARSIGSPLVYERYTGAKEIVDSAIRLISSRSVEDGPFYLYLHLMDTHEPYNPPERYKIACTTDSAGLVPDFLLYQFLRSIGRARGKEELTDADTHFFLRAKDLYDASVRYVDDSLRTLIGFFRERGLFDNTLFVFSSDHGEEFGEHQWIGHSRTLYQESLRSPLIFFGAGVAPGARVSDPVSSLDIAPTILRECGARIPQSMFGRPLDLSGATERDPLVAVSALTRPCEPGEIFEKMYALSDPRGMTLIRHEYQGSMAGQPPKSELYDRRKDPLEEADVTAANPTVIAALEKQLQLIRDSHKSGAGKGLKLDDKARQALKALGYLNG